MIFEQVQDLVGVLNSGGNNILLPPFDSLGGMLPLVLPFLRLHFERLFVVRVDGQRISDGLGRDENGDCFVGCGGCHRLSYGRDEAPEDIGSICRNRCIFASSPLIYLRPRCHFLLGQYTAGSDKLGYLSRNYTTLKVGHGVKRIYISCGRNYAGNRSFSACGSEPFKPVTLLIPTPIIRQ